MVLIVGAATKLRLAIYLPLLGLAVLVLLMRTGALAAPGDDFGTPHQGPPLPHYPEVNMRMTSADGTRVELPFTGEFDIAISQSGDLRIQQRVIERGGYRVFDAIAAKVGGSRVEITKFGGLRIDGFRARLRPEQRVYFGADNYVTKSGDQHVIVWNDHAQRSELTVDVGGWSLIVPSWHAHGLLGPSDGRADNDLTTREGKVLYPHNKRNIRRIAESWRVPERESLFTTRR